MPIHTRWTEQLHIKRRGRAQNLHRHLGGGCPLGNVDRWSSDDTHLSLDSCKQSKEHAEHSRAHMGGQTPSGRPLRGEIPSSCPEAPGPPSNLNCKAQQLAVAAACAASRKLRRSQAAGQAPTAIQSSAPRSRDHDRDFQLQRSLGLPHACIHTNITPATTSAIT